jgi:hypothetical protein
MNTQGISAIDHLGVDLLDVVFFGDVHAAYDPFMNNVLHEWIDLSITQRETSFCVAEGVNANDLSFILSLIPNYFLAKNVYFCDKIRFDVDMIQTVDKTLSINPYHVNHTLNALNTITDNINPAAPFKKRGIYEYQPDIPSIVSQMNHDRSYMPEFIKTVEQTSDGLYAYNPLPSDYAKIKNIYTNRHPFEFDNQNLHLSNLMINYELSSLEYMWYNFIYRVARWLTRMIPGTQLNDGLYSFVYNTYRAAQKHKLSMHQTAMVYASCHLLDFVMILRILDLYEQAYVRKTKYLLWVPAGNAHTMVMMDFLRIIFNKLQTANITTIVSYNPVAALDNYYHLGFKPPVSLPFDPDETRAWSRIINNNNQKDMIDGLRTIIINNKKNGYFKNKLGDLIKILDRTQFSVKILQKILIYIKIKRVLASFTEEEITNFLASDISTLSSQKIIKYTTFGKTNTIENGEYKYIGEQHYTFTSPFTGLYIPSFTEHQALDISIYNILDCLTDPQSFNISNLKEGVKLSELPPNDPLYVPGAVIPVPQYDDVPEPGESANVMLDTTGISTIEFMENSALRLVLVGAVPGKYEDKYYSLHNWITKYNIPNAKYITDSLDLFVTDCAQSVLVRYFNSLKVLFANGISGEFYLLRGKNALHQDEDVFNAAKEFMIYPCQTQKLKKASMILYNKQMPKNNITDMDKGRPSYHHRITPGLDYFISTSSQYDTVYDRLVEPDKKQNIELLTSTIKAIKAPTEKISYIYLPETFDSLHMLYTYELLLYQYITYNFIYRVAHFLHTQTNGRTVLNNELFNRINNLITDNLVNKPNIDDYISRLGPLDSFVAILHILDQYSSVSDVNKANNHIDGVNPEEKQPIWICMRYEHLDFIRPFLSMIFNEIGDVFVVNQFKGKEYENIPQTINVEQPVESQAFIDLITANLSFGLEKPVYKKFLMPLSPILFWPKWDLQTFINNSKSVSFKLFREDMELLQIPTTEYVEKNNVVLPKKVTLSVFPRTRSKNHMFKQLNVQELIRSVTERPPLFNGYDVIISDYDDWALLNKTSDIVINKQLLVAYESVLKLLRDNTYVTDGLLNRNKKNIIARKHQKAEKPLKFLYDVYALRIDDLDNPADIQRQIDTFNKVATQYVNELVRGLELMTDADPGVYDRFKMLGGVDDNYEDGLTLTTTATASVTPSAQNTQNKQNIFNPLPFLLASMVSTSDILLVAVLVILLLYLLHQIITMNSVENISTTENMNADYRYTSKLIPYFLT